MGPLWELTVPFHVTSRRVDELDLVLAQPPQRSEILILAFVREGVDALVAVVEICKQYIRA